MEKEQLLIPPSVRRQIGLRPPFSLIWERYFIKETLQVFFLFLFCFYGLYVLIDFSSHAALFHHHHIRFRLVEIGFYYLCDFIKRLDVLVPFALMIATIKTLTSLNVHNELVALMASGIRLKSLLRPFIFLGLCCMALIYANTQWLVPSALNALKQIDETRSNQKNKAGVTTAQHLLLEDESTLLFQNYDSAKKLFFDAYWIPSLNDVYRIKYLYPYADVPTGHFVDHFMRNDAGELVLHGSFTSRPFPEILFNSASLTETITSAEELSLTELNAKIVHDEKIISEKQSQIEAIFFYKMIMPWLCLLAVMGPAPFCVRYTRQLPVFFIYAGGIFTFVSLYLILDASVIIAKRQVADALPIIFIPFGLFFGFFIFRYVRLR